MEGTENQNRDGTNMTTMAVSTDLMDEHEVVIPFDKELDMWFFESALSVDEVVPGPDLDIMGEDCRKEGKEERKEGMVEGSNDGYRKDLRKEEKEGKVERKEGTVEGSNDGSKKNLRKEDREEKEGRKEGTVEEGKEGRKQGTVEGSNEGRRKDLEGSNGGYRKDLRKEEKERKVERKEGTIEGSNDGNRKDLRKEEKEEKEGRKEGTVEEEKEGRKEGKVVGNNEGNRKDIRKEEIEGKEGRKEGMVVGSNEGNKKDFRKEGKEEMVEESKEGNRKDLRKEGKEWMIWGSNEENREERKRRKKKLVSGDPYLRMRISELEAQLREAIGRITCLEGQLKGMNVGSSFSPCKCGLKEIRKETERKEIERKETERKEMDRKKTGRKKTVPVVSGGYNVTTISPFLIGEDFPLPPLFQRDTCNFIARGGGDWVSPVVQSPPLCLIGVLKVGGLLGRPMGLCPARRQNGNWSVEGVEGGGRILLLPYHFLGGNLLVWRVMRIWKLLTIGRNGAPHLDGSRKVGPLDRPYHRRSQLMDELRVSPTWRR